MKRLGKTRRPQLERLEDRLVLTLPFGALPTDTGEFLLGDVLVNVVLMESQGPASTEDWTPALIQSAKDKVEQGTQWWVDTLRNYEQKLGIVPGTHPLNFHFNYEFADTPVDTPHEPIAEVASNFETWIEDFFTAAGVSSSGSFHDQILEFNHNQRLDSGDDWSFTVFVVNDDVDLDGQFAYESGGFSQAFAYPGGEFLISPAGRPVSTFAHELGHIFWARDEYANASSYTQRRGYYDALNSNAADNPQFQLPGEEQGASIMAAGTKMMQAFSSNENDEAALHMIGWRDADHDGLFDVLVPHSLTGSGSYDNATGVYRFLGSSSVNTLPNQNSSGNQSDITINVIREVQYRFDGGSWQTIDIADGHQVDLDLSINAPQGGFQTIEIRTFDSRTGVASPEFQGVAGVPTSTDTPGISGFVRYDANNNGEVDPGESGLAGWTVEIVDPASSLDNSIEPDDYAATGIPIAPLGASVMAEGGLDIFVYAGSGNPASTGNSVFRFVQGYDDGLILLSEAWNEDIRLRFNLPATSYFQIDAVGNGGGDYARVEFYNSSGQLLGRRTTGLLQQGDVETISFGRAEGDIAYAIAYGFAGTGVQFDNMHYGAPTSAVTDASGAFTLPYLPDGVYTLQVTPPAGGTVTGGQFTPILYQAGQIESGVMFSGLVAAGQNPDNPYDVNDDEAVDLGDILALVSELRTNGSYPVSEGSGFAEPPFCDVNSDEQVDFNDVLAIVAYLRNQGAGEALADGGFEPSVSFGDAGSDGSGTSSGGGTTSEPEAIPTFLASAPSQAFSGPLQVSSSGDSTLSFTPVTIVPFTRDTSQRADSDSVPTSPPQPVRTFELLAAAQASTFSRNGEDFDGGGLFGSGGGGSLPGESVDDAFAVDDDFVDLLPSLEPPHQRETAPTAQPSVHKDPTPRSRERRRDAGAEQHDAPTREESDEADRPQTPDEAHQNADEERTDDEQARDLIFRELERSRARREHESTDEPRDGALHNDASDAASTSPDDS